MTVCEYLALLSVLSSFGSAIVSLEDSFQRVYSSGAMVQAIANMLNRQTQLIKGFAFENRAALSPTMAHGREQVRTTWCSGKQRRQGWQRQRCCCAKSTATDEFVGAELLTVLRAPSSSNGRDGGRRTFPRSTFTFC